jgi:RimJ/RimL family protein N-acetyltransferase
VDPQPIEPEIPTPTLLGERVRLRPPEERDILRRAELGRNPEINRAFGGDLETDRPLTVDEARRQLTPMPDTFMQWAIAETDGDVFVGMTNLSRLDQPNRSAVFGIGIFDPDRLDQGLGTEATRLVVDYGFNRLGLHRISLVVLADNQRAVAAYRKAGFEVEGRLRHTLWSRGRWHDDLIMAVLAEDEA